MADALKGAMSKKQPMRLDCPHCGGLGEVSNPDHDPRIYCPACLAEHSDSRTFDGDHLVIHCVCSHTLDLSDDDSLLTHQEYLQRAYADDVALSNAIRDGLVKP